METDKERGVVDYVITPGYEYDLEGARAAAVVTGGEWERREMLALAESLGVEVVKTFHLGNLRIRPKYYIGSGKVEEVAAAVEAEDADTVIVYAELKPSQVFHLEQALEVRVIDRNMLILQIFLHRARMKEAKLQVEYAILNYQRPYIRELVRRTKMGEHPGYLTGGEYKVDEYQELMKRRLKKIRGELEKISVHREMRRKRRRKRGFDLVSIAGYTNAGKSSLLKALTREKVRIGDTLFSTLSTTTRRFRSEDILFTDTVGFIRGIPPQLIEAFHSTLEEMLEADLVLLVVDLEEDEGIIREKMDVSLSVIGNLMEDSPAPPVHIVFNKRDLVKEPERKAASVLDDIDPILPLSDHSVISCKTGKGIDSLVERSVDLCGEE